MSELADVLERGFLTVALIAVLTWLFVALVHLLEQWRRR